MNKNILMVVIAIVLVIATYVGVFVLGRNSIKAPVGKIEVKEVIRYDTVQTIKRIYINRLVEAKTKGDSIKTYEDRIVGDTLETKYDIFHSVSDSQKTIRSWWKVNIEPHISTIIKTITRDSIQTKINNVYLTKPFLMDSWFYVSLISWLVTALAIIF